MVQGRVLHCSFICNTEEILRRSNFPNSDLQPVGPGPDPGLCFSPLATNDRLELDLFGCKLIMQAFKNYRVRKQHREYSVRLDQTLPHRRRQWQKNRNLILVGEGRMHFKIKKNSESKIEEQSIYLDIFILYNYISELNLNIWALTYQLEKRV